MWVQSQCIASSAVSTCGLVQLVKHGTGSAIVTDSGLRTALFTIRNLGVHGVRVTAVDRDQGRLKNLGGISRYVSRTVVVPSVHEDAAGYAEALLGLADPHDVLMLTGMHSIEAVARQDDGFISGTRVAIPPWSTIERADNTRALLELAAELGIPIPRTLNEDDFPSLHKLADEARFPVIVKLGVEAGLPPEKRYDIVNSHRELSVSIRRLRRYTPKPLIQEVVNGPGVGFEALYDYDSRLVASFCHKRLREYPLSGGPSTFCESCHIPRVEELGRRILDHLKWIGLAMVEFKLDQETGEPVLLEINPRPWGSMALPIRAGVEFPWLAYQLARDGCLPVQPDYPDGVRLRFIVNDLQAAFAEIGRTQSIRKRMGICLSLLDPRVKEGVLMLRDPIPTVAYVMKGLGRAFGGANSPRAVGGRS